MLWMHCVNQFIRCDIGSSRSNESRVLLCQDLTMNVLSTEIPEVLLLEPRVFGDDRGFFFESFNQQAFTDKTGTDVRFVQDNHSRSAKNVLRGLHYQVQQPQGKLVRAVVGEVLDVAVDIRKSSPTLGKWVARVLSAENKRSLWVPAGFAHGFLVLSDWAEVLYKATDFYAPAHERSILWNDPEINVDWNFDEEPILSGKDQAAKLFKDADLFD